MIRKRSSTIIALLAGVCLLAGVLAGTMSAAVPANAKAEANLICYLRAGANFNLTPKHCNQKRQRQPRQQSVQQNSVAAQSQTQTNISSTMQSQPSGKYAALGDSVAAGLGLPLASQGQIDQLCGRSSQAYPHLVAQSLGRRLTHAACSGATAGDLVTDQRVSSTTEVQPQLDTAFAGGKPQLITITAGANDAHWVDFIKACYITNCSTSAYTDAAQVYLTLLKVKLAYSLESINVRSGGQPPQVYMTGYYTPVSANCTNVQPQITRSDLRWLVGETNKLNQTIQDVTSNFSFVHFVPVSFAGHGLCSAQPWVQGLNDPAPLHPTAQGQRVIANDVLNAIR